MEFVGEVELDKSEDELYDLSDYISNNSQLKYDQNIEHQNRKLLDSLFDSLYQEGINDTCEPTKSNKLNRNVGTHNRPQNSIEPPNVLEWTRIFPHFRVNGKMIDTIKTVTPQERLSPVLCKPNDILFDDGLCIKGNQITHMKLLQDEVLSSDGEYEEIFAIDSGESDNKLVSSIPTPIESLKDEIVDVLVYNCWNKLIPLFKPLLFTIHNIYLRFCQNTKKKFVDRHYVHFIDDQLSIKGLNPKKSNGSKISSSPISIRKKNTSQTPRPFLPPLNKHQSTTNNDEYSGHYLSFTGTNVGVNNILNNHQSGSGHINDNGGCNYSGIASRINVCASQKGYRNSSHNQRALSQKSNRNYIKLQPIRLDSDHFVINSSLKNK